MAATQVPRNTVGRRTFIIRDAGGNPVDPDGSPIVITVQEVQLNGFPTALISASVDQLFNDSTSPEQPVVGYFAVKFLATYAGIASGDHIAVRFSTVVGGNTVEAVAEFVIDQQSERAPFIDVS